MEVNKVKRTQFLPAKPISISLNRTMLELNLHSFSLV